MDEKERLLRDIDAFLSITGMAATTLGRKAVNDGKAIGRLRKGGRMWPEQIQRLRAFMTSNRDYRPRRAAA